VFSQLHQCYFYHFPAHVVDGVKELMLLCDTIIWCINFNSGPHPIETLHQQFTRVIAHVVYILKIVNV
jgi:hypothetical protein